MASDPLFPKMTDVLCYSLKTNLQAAFSNQGLLSTLTILFSPQLPVVSVMRETESQLLPDVGAVVTCKVSGS